MKQAVALATRGLGKAEPNPMVGAVLVANDGCVIGEGYHQQFGGPHAEVDAIRSADGKDLSDVTLYVTLEPCCHHGKTPPCTQAILDAGIQQVVIGTVDPAPHAAGKGIEQLRAAGVSVEVGVFEGECKQLIAPFAKLITTGKPFVHAKWAMSLDGKIATRTGHSKWISNEGSRRVVHELRGHMDAVLVGANTARLDNPLLTTRPESLTRRTAARVVVDGRCSLSLDSQLVQTAGEFPLLVATTKSADSDAVSALQDRGAEVVMAGEGGRVDLELLLNQLGSREMTNILVEGGAELLGSFHDGGLIDEVHTFVSTKVIGGEAAKPAILGQGLENVPSKSPMYGLQVREIDGDIYINGRL